MDHGESGSGTPFESMSHEEMLAWLDQANSGAIQGAADRLVSAATEIRKIAEDLKVRPQWVEWKGEGADAFRTWSADLANSTLRLGDYSEGASKWLTQASNAIASAQAAIPRTQAGAQANLDAALAARNDPDASAVAQKSAETLIATQEANRQEAAAQMRKLAQTYSLSASQMDGLEKPAFPPPPQAIVPEREGGIGDSEGWAPPGGDSGSGGAGGGVGYAATTDTSPAEVSDPGTSGAVDRAVVQMPARSGAPVGMEIDGVATLPESLSTPIGSPTGLPLTGKPDGNSPLGPSIMPPVFGGNPTLTPNQQGAGRYTGTGVRPPSLSGPNGLGSGPTSRMPRDTGISGGRPVTQTGGRPTGGLPRGTVVGGEGTRGRGPLGRGAGIGGPSGGQSGLPGSRRLAGESGGVVGGRSQQPGRSSGRPFTPGGSGLVRGNGASDGTRAVGQAGRGANAAAGARPGSSRRDDGERPDYLTEDEETWQQGGRRVVPPVID
ncbi:hypothetical protein ACFRCW_12410 [Streptomyces sp. NPDC056653]|uniref:hypothetical protein n=1 Tax=Streptomyces sp. NPDC056653 TaxID=3345894 RepID=UPI0036BD7B7B